MRYIDKWLTGLGLDYVIPKLEANGITTPKKLAQLTLRDMFEVVGVEDPEDRKKLYFLIQRLQSILNKSESENGDDEETNDIESNLTRLNSGPSATTSPVATSRKTVEKPKDEEKDDLKSLRRMKTESASARTVEEESVSTGRTRSSSNPAAYNAQALPPSSKVTKETGKDENRRVSTGIKAPIKSQSSSAKEEPKSGLSLIKGKSVIQPPSRDTSPRVPTPTQLSQPSSRNTSPVRRPSTASDARGSASSEGSSRQSLLSGAVSQPISSASAQSLRNASGIAQPIGYPRQDSGPQYDEYDNPTTDYEEAPPQHPPELTSQDMAIRVVVRKRPMSRSELNRGERDVLEILPGGRVEVHEPKTKVDLTKIVETQAFVFDDAFDCDENNDVIYGRTVKPLVQNVFAGGKATCFAYGQTGSGKTFTMMGVDASVDPGKVGLYVLAALDIFAILKAPEYKMHQAYVSCFEIYGGKLFDLLHERGLVKCLEDSKQQVQILGLTEHRVLAVENLIELMRVAHNERSTGATGANAESSRSHLIMQIEIKKQAPANSASQPNRRVTNSFQRQFKEQAPKLTSVGKLTFIDLAGSERGKDTTDNSKQTRMEGAEINTSLLALKEVIRSLNRQHGHTPFRGSKLTQVLKDSFVGENTRTCMVACVSPNHINCEHTLNTLRYADRVKEHQVSAGGGPAPAESEFDEDKLSSPPIPPPSSRPVTASAPLPSSRMSTGAIPSSSQRQGNSIQKLPSFSNEEDQDSEISSKSRKSMMIKKTTSIDSTNTTKSREVATPRERERERDVTPPPPPPAIQDKDGDFNNTAVIQMTVNLLTTHKMSIADMVEVMKEEMQLVQDMENAEERDSEGYVDKLEQILAVKMQGITALKKELKAFQGYRDIQRDTGANGKYQFDDDISVYSDDMLSVPGSRSIQQAVVKQQLSKLPNTRSTASSLRRPQVPSKR